MLRLKVPQDDLNAFKKIKDKHAAYTVISQKRIPEQIIEKAKKAKECPHCGKTQYGISFYKTHYLCRKN